MPDEASTRPAVAGRSEAYEVLARKHRPQHFDALIGQESLVRTLRNAFESERIAHAFILTGIRGIGKTTTARIIARALNCTGGGSRDIPAFNPCGACPSCVSISESRHIDVVEIDAASHTGVDHARELIGEARHSPALGRYRVFIVDEVHMLSRSAFNALLKTLEEPPPHAKFILATTEIRKVPVTVLSRCQRFDLRRVESDMLMRHIGTIANAEGVEVDGGALALIARAAEGSVRDAISLLDQSIAHRGEDGAISAASVRDMLALADRARVLDLFEKAASGDAAGALAELASQHRDGAEPLNVLESLAETCHFVSVLRVAPEIADDPALSPEERQRCVDFAKQLTPPTLVRFWQILENALDEVRRSERPRLAADMAVLRLTYASTLPTPDELIARLEGQNPASRNASAGSAGPGSEPGSAPRGPGPATGSSRLPAAAPIAIRSASDLAELARSRGEHGMLRQIERELKPVKFEECCIQFEPGSGATRFFPRELRTFLEKATGASWTVVALETGGGPTIQEIRDRERSGLEAKVLRHPKFLEMQKDSRRGSLRRLLQRYGIRAECRLIHREGAGPVGGTDGWDLRTIGSCAGTGPGAPRDAPSPANPLRARVAANELRKR